MPVTANNFGVQGFAFPVVSSGGGSCDYPADGDVRDGVLFDSGNRAGTFVVPAESDVRLDVGYGADGTEFDGTLAVPTFGEAAEAYSPADVVRWLLVALGQGTDPSAQGSWPVFATNEPPSPDEVITVYDTSPQEDGRNQVDGVAQTHHGIQVRVRAKDHNRGYARAHALKACLDQSVLNNTVHVGGITYTVYAVSGASLLYLGKDTPVSKRSLFTINAYVSLRAT